MKFPVIILFVVAVVFTSTAGADPKAVQAVRCVKCGRILGRDVPETALSRDPDFKRYRMFQVCQSCLNKQMSKRAQANYARVAFKYKWNSIAHNLSEAIRFRTR